VSNLSAFDRMLPYLNRLDAFKKELVEAIRKVVTPAALDVPETRVLCLERGEYVYAPSHFLVDCDGLCVVLNEVEDPRDQCIRTFYEHEWGEDSLLSLSAENLIHLLELAMELADERPKAKAKP
jgi:hypothetical protein